jgi:hypothetical protein
MDTNQQLAHEKDLAAFLENIWVQVDPIVDRIYIKLGQGTSNENPEVDMNSSYSKIIICKGSINISLMWSIQGLSSEISVVWNKTTGSPSHK